MITQEHRLACTQGVYFALTGVWPLLHMRSFEAVTGPKTDKWLVKTVGTLIAIIGGVLVSAASRRRITPEIAGLALGTATGLGAVDVVYAVKGRISPIYLADAVLEATLVSAWIARTAPRASHPR
jgi:hypothetical protein